MNAATYVRLRTRILASPVGQPLRLIRRSLSSKAARQDAIDNSRLRAILAAVLRPDSHCIDIGAHHGAVLEDLVRLAPSGRHFAFEPLPHLAQDLTRQFPQVKIEQLALSDRPGEADFIHVVTRPGFSGFRKRSLPRLEETETITVKTARLDDVLPDEVAPAFIKIDVEGAEYLVLRGATETIARHRPMLAFEYGLGAADFYGVRPEDMFSLIADEFGMRIFDLDGNGPYTLPQLITAFERHERVNFLANA